MTGIGKNGVADTVLPDGWCETSIGVHFEFKNGLNKAKEFFGYGTPIVNYMDVYRQPWLLRSHVTGKVDVTRNEQQAYSARQHDAFFTRTSETVDEIGMCSVLMEPIENAVFSGFVLRARPLNGTLSSSFAAYALRGRAVRQQIESSATYTTRALTNGKSLSAVTFALPPPNEQQRIASALKDIDELIASLDALIAKKRDIKQAAMQQLLTGKTRLLGSEGEWETRRLGELADFAAGGTPRTDVPPYWGGSIPWMSSGELHYKRINEVSGRITELGLKRSAAKMIPPKSVLVGLAGQGKTRGTVALSEVELSTNQSIAAIIPSEDIDPDFLYHNLDSRYDELRFLSSGDGGRGGLNLAILKGLDIALPPLREQREIAIFLNELDFDRTTSERKLKKLNSLKEAMMQQLLTGRIRLV